MAIWIRSVDPQWLAFVESRPDFDEVNLWSSTENRLFKGAETGDLVLFRVNNRIAGYGSFFNAAIFWARDAWDIFGQKNGFATEELFIKRVKDRRKTRDLQFFAIACHDIVQPTYFSGLQARLPGDAPARLGQGPIDEESADGLLLLAFLHDVQATPRRPEIDEISKSERAIQPGRSGFRMLVTGAYGRTCAISRVNVVFSLDSAHVVPDRLGGVMQVGNALLLRKDLHPLLDLGFLTISESHRVMISRWLPWHYSNSQDYTAFHGAPLLLPQDRAMWPDPDLLAWHRTEIFLKGGVIGGDVDGRSEP